MSKSGHSTTVEYRIASARGYIYSLMGPGLLSETGGNPRVSLFLWSTYVLPPHTYDLKTLKCKTSTSFSNNTLSKVCISGRERLTQQYICCLAIASVGGSTQESLYASR